MSELYLCDHYLTTLEGIDFPDDLIELYIGDNLLTSLQYCPLNVKRLSCFNKEVN